MRSKFAQKQMATWHLLVGVFLLLEVLQVCLGVSPVSGLKISGLVCLQTLSGALIWSLCTRGRSDSPRPFELLGMGLGIGPTLSVLTSLMLRHTVFDSWSWAVPSLIVVAISLAIPGLIRRTLKTTTETAATALTFLGCYLFSLLFVLAFWLAHPLKWTGWWAFYGDVYFHEALSRSIWSVGPGDSTFSSGQGIHYHWFGDAWAGLVTRATEAAGFVALTRTLFLVAFIAIILLSWTWARALSDKWYVPPLASLTTVGAASIGSGLGNTNSMVFGDFSPTHTYAMVVSLAICVFVARFLRSTVRLWSLLLFIFLAFALMGSRVTQAIMIFSGLSLLLVWCFVFRRSSFDRAVWLWVSALFGFAISFVLVILGGTANGLALAPNAEIASLWGLVPFGGTPGLVLGALSMVAAVTAACAGLIWFLKANPRTWAPSVPLVLGVVLSGILASLLTAQPGRAQVSFIWAAVAIAGTLSAVGALNAIHAFWTESGERRRFQAVASAVVLALVLAAFTWFVPGVITSLGLPAVMRTAIPVILWAAVAFSAWIMTKTMIGNTKGSLNLFIFMVVASSLFVGLIAIPFKIAARQTAASPQTPLALNSGYFEAASSLIALNTRSELVATNRFCGDVADSTPDCSSIVFNVSALTGLPTLLEGYDYSVGYSPGSGVPLPPWATTRVLTANQFADSPSQENAQVLWDLGVRWFWVDNVVTSNRDWAPYAETPFMNSEVTLLKLNNPSG